MGGPVDRNRELRYSRREDQTQVKSLPFELLDFHEAVVQSGDLATQQGHRLDLSIFLRVDDFLGLLGCALGQTSGDLEAIDGAAGSDFVGERGGEILYRPETLDEVIDDIHVEQERGLQCRDLPGIGLSQVNA